MRRSLLCRKRASTVRAWHNKKPRLRGAFHKTKNSRAVYALVSVPAAAAAAAVPSSRSPRPQTPADALFPYRLRALSGARSHAPCPQAGNREGLCAVALHVVLQSPDSCSYSLQTHSGGASTPKANVNYRQIPAICLAESLLRQRRGRAAAPDHGFREALHPLKLRAELQQQQIHAYGLKLRHALGNLLRRPDQPRPQPAIRYRIIFQRYALLELRTRQPLLIIFIPGRGLLHICNSPQFVLRFALRLAHNRVARHAKFQRRQIVFRAAFPQIRNLLAHAFRRITMHQVRVAFFRYQLLSSRRFASGV